MISWRRPLLVLGVLVLLSGLILGQAILPMPRENLFWRSVFDAAHVPVFGLFALFVRVSLDWARRRPSVGHDVLALIVAGLLGALVEVAQSFTGRHASLMDLVRDLLGAAAVLVLVRALTGRPWPGVAVRSALAVAALGLALFAILAPVEGVLAYRQRDAAFPVLCQFEDDWTARFTATRDVEVEFVPRLARWEDQDSETVARLTFGTSPYPAFILREPQPSWSDYRTLVFSFFNPGERPQPLLVRVDDFRHNGSIIDRFNGQIEVPPGSSEVEISLSVIEDSPRDRDMDLDQVRSVTLFAGRPKSRIVIYLGEIRLQ